MKIGEISLVEIEPQKVLVARKKGRLREINYLLQQIYRHISTNYFVVSGSPPSIRHDITPESAGNLGPETIFELEAAVPVEYDVSEKENITLYELPGGRMARLIQQYPRFECRESCLKLFEWISESGLTVRGPVRELYLSDPKRTPTYRHYAELLVPV